MGGLTELAAASVVIAAGALFAAIVLGLPWSLPLVVIGLLLLVIGLEGGAR